MTKKRSAVKSKSVSKKSLTKAKKHGPMKVKTSFAKKKKAGVKKTPQRSSASSITSTVNRSLNSASKMGKNVVDNAVDMYGQLKVLCAMCI